jgi:hypothetical protein
MIPDDPEYHQFVREIEFYVTILMGVMFLILAMNLF